jgi:UDP-GlcNAc:undecaprenyl-phosphate/decaprenyl-phosphate GlcNAc-1-phosphate transferase
MTLPLAICASFLVTLTLMPVIIRLFRSIDLLDIPDKRKIHSISTPSLGGIAIFIGIVFSLIISATLVDLSTQKYLLGGVLLIFLLGVRDDLSSLQARHKLVVQIFAAFLVVYFGNTKIDGFGGLFGIDSFPWYFSEIFTVFVIVVMTNAFNLIDGIDGLAGSIVLMISLFFGWIFLSSGLIVEAGFSLAIAGGILAFLLYNWYPSKVFMGDTGSMMLGFMLTALLINFINIPYEISNFSAPVSVCLALFLLPVYDTMRVFIIRFLSGKSPLAPDRNHIHHVLLKFGFNHGKATILLISYNLAIIFGVYFFQEIGNGWLILIMGSMTTIIGMALDFKLVKREEARTASLTSSEIKFTKSA